MGSYWDANGKLVDGRYELANRLTTYTTIANAVSVAASGSTTIAPTTVTGFLTGKIVVQSSGNCNVRIEAYSKAGARMGVPSARILDINGVAGANQIVKDFNINGIESIAAYVVDTSVATNTITIDLALSQ